ncbi:hypothetical protein HZS_7611 [Henneguya salminicola]|nr:hypothetical protein HZS_7611 [Henneguya salminicola]
MVINLYSIIQSKIVGLTKIPLLEIILDTLTKVITHGLLEVPSYKGQNKSETLFVMLLRDNKCLGMQIGNENIKEIFSTKFNPMKMNKCKPQNLCQLWF